MLVLCLAASAADGAAEIDFLREVFPILETRCLPCHGADRQEGDLRLDRKDFVLQGGHSGNEILAPGAANGILQRVIAVNEAVRMPLGEPQLPDAQIAILKSWAEQGSRWVDPPRRASPLPIGGLPEIETARFSFTWNDLLDWNFSRWSDAGTIEFVFWRNRLIVPLLLVLLFALACERCRESVRRTEPEGDRSAQWNTVRRLANVPRSVHLVGLLSVATLFAWSYYQSQAKRADRLLADSARQIRMLIGQGESSDDVKEGSFPQPVRPKHPRRLGGVYYRGNDERNPALFNGGFYRTATITIGLHRRDGTELRWGDTVCGEPLFIRIRIEQSPSTAEALFADSVWEETFCSELGRGVPLTDSSTQTVGFRKVGDKVRQAMIPVRPADDSELHRRGTIYVYRGKFNNGTKLNEPHYGIVYDLTFDRGVIAPQSELWMGHVFKTGKVFSVPPDRIPEDEWFSFRPIPEIEGEQTTQDPVLLGIPANTGRTK